MSEELVLGVTTTIVGIFIGFFGNYGIAKFNARNELKKSISTYRAEHYLELWKLCDRKVQTQGEQLERSARLNEWYDKGGGLLLPFKATDRLIGAINILASSSVQKLEAEQMTTLKTDLSWLRTEMKYEVGSYSRKEADRLLPNIRTRK